MTSEVTDRDKELEVGRALAAAARDFFVPASIEDTLQGVTASAKRLITGVDTADILIVAGRGKFQSHAPTGDLVVRLDKFQEEFGEGPCVDAAFDEMVVRSDDLNQESRWPAFTRAALGVGVQSLISFKLFTRDDTVGAMNLFALRPNAFDTEDTELGLMLAAHAAVALHAANATQQFQSALVSRDVIAQAKGMIMERFNMDAIRAFEVLRKLSQDENIPVSALAAQIVAGNQ